MVRGIFFTILRSIKSYKITLYKNVKFFIKLKLSLHILFLVFVCFCVGFWPALSYAQTPNRPDLRQAPVLDQNRPKTDTTVSVPDTLRKKGDIETTVKYTARDSIVLDVETKITLLYGDATVDYGNISLKADQIELNYLTNLVHAKGSIDSTGKLIGAPVFKEGAENYNADEIRYNFKTRKAIIKGAVTKQGEGFVQGAQVKKDPEDNLFISNAIYTTCDLKHPHFHISARKIKIVHDKQVVTGPFNLVIADIPTPLGFPFGLFPLIKNKPNGTSGIIVPTYGEESNARGFFLRNGGYYWALSQHIGLTFLGEVYSRGGWGLSAQSNYKKRYSFDGSFSLRFNKISIEATDGSTNSGQDFWVDWSHRPVPRGLSTFSASVSAGTSKFNARNSFDPNAYLSNAFRSSISYSTSFRNTPFRTAINLNHDQNTRTGVVNLLLPSVTFNMNRLYPLKPRLSTGKGWWETLSVGFDFSGAAQISNAARAAGGFPFRLKENAINPERRDSALAFTPANFGTLLRRAQIGGSYTVPISASVKFLKYFSLNPGVNYQGYVYPYHLDYQYNGEGTVTVDTVRQLSHAYNFSTGASITTRIYGTVNINSKNLQAIRHTIIPSIGLSYSPNFSDPGFGFYQWVQIKGVKLPYSPDIHPDTLKQNYRLMSRYQGFRAGGPSSGQAGNISFSLNNTIDAKVRVKGDSTGKKFEKVSLLNSLNLSTAYNLLADSLNLSNINISANTRFLKSFDVNASATVDPYLYERDNFIRANTTGVRVNKYAFQYGQGIGQLSNANIGISTSFRPGGVRKSNDDQKKRIENADAPEEEKARILQNPNLYVDFNIPWNLNVSYSFNYSKVGLNKPVTSQTLSFNGDISLTPKWKLGFTSGYDFVNKGISYTNININRDLHCWQMSIQWSPFGGRQFYMFTLNVKSSLLRDLKLTQQRSFADNNPSLYGQQ
jgi:hypothetical protein